MIRSFFIILYIFSASCLSVQADNSGSEQAPPEKSLLASFNAHAFDVIFWDVSQGYFKVPQLDKGGQPLFDEQHQVVQRTVKMPFIVVLLALGAIFFTLFYRFINFRMFKHAFDVVRGKYDHREDRGEITHFKALTSALSATIGLGNIAGVAVAIQTGGPGAVFWMTSIAFFGMSSKFSSCTLAQLYRKENGDGTISGGPMYYLDMGLSEMKLGTIGKILGLMYAVMIMGGALGGGNMFQVNQTAEAFRSTFALSESANLPIGIIMMLLVGVVILGGIQRIGEATSKMVPAMCAMYVLASISVLTINYEKIPHSFALIYTMAFSQNALFGGVVGVMITGITRAAFSNEAGLGSSSIAHAAAKTNEPVREGIVAMLEPFIDTVIVCNMTALVVIVSGAWNDPQIPASAGVALTMAAFSTVSSWFPYILAICIALFAYSTMISWCYYGERGWIYLWDHVREGMGLKSLWLFRLVFLGFVLIGATHKLSDVIDFSDVMLLCLAFPNILGSMVLAPRVWVRVKDYMEKYKNKQMKANW